MNSKYSFVGLVQDWPNAARVAQSKFPLIGGAPSNALGYLFELVLGLVLLAGIQLRWTALLSGILLLTFWLSMATAYAKGLIINCGCFGDSEQV